MGKEGRSRGEEGSERRGGASTRLLMYGPKKLEFNVLQRVTGRGGYEHAGGAGPGAVEEGCLDLITAWRQKRPSRRLCFNDLRDGKAGAWR